jgi:formate-dependent nitrite reductase membrane component NrfD
MKAQSESQPPKRKFSERTLGFFMFIAGIAGLAVGIFEPLRDAAHHKQVFIPALVVLFTPPLIGIGLLNLLMGKTAQERFGHPKRPSARGWIVYAVLMGVGLLIYLWLENAVRSGG